MARFRYLVSFYFVWFLLFIPFFQHPSPARAATLSVVVDRTRYQNVVERLQHDFGDTNKIQIHNLKGVNFSHPVQKGRFLAQIANADLVIPIGDSAAQMIEKELDELPTFFIASAALSGPYLSRRHVSGILSYSPEETVQVATALLPHLKAIGVLFTPGYEPVVIKMKSASQKMGLTLAAHPVRSRKDVSPLARRLAADVDLIWIVGDPLLTHDLIFLYLIQESFQFKTPVAGPVRELIKKGGLFCTIPDKEMLAHSAAQALGQLLQTNGTLKEPSRIQFADKKGVVLINSQLAKKWNIQVPDSLRLWKGNEP